MASVQPLRASSSGATASPNALEPWKQLVTWLADLMRSAEQGSFSMEGFREARRRLDRLPLAQPDYWAARKRLENTWNLLLCNNVAEACAELALMARDLQRGSADRAPRFPGSV